MYVAGGVLLKEREESVCRGRSVAEGDRGECMSQEECYGRRERRVYVAEEVLRKQREESVCRGRSVAEGERGECMSLEECC